MFYVGNSAQTIMGIGGQPNGDSSSSIGRVRHAVYMHQSDAKVNGGTRLRGAERTRVPRRTPLGSETSRPLRSCRVKESVLRALLNRALLNKVGRRS